MALESSQRAHAAAILIDLRLKDRVARRVLAEVDARDYFDGDRGGGYPVDSETERRPRPKPETTRCTVRSTSIMRAA